jgi:hypothetical protein
LRRAATAGCREKQASDDGGGCGCGDDLDGGGEGLDADLGCGAEQIYLPSHEARVVGGVDETDALLTASGTAEVNAASDCKIAELESAAEDDKVLGARDMKSVRSASRKGASLLIREYSSIDVVEICNGSFSL